MSEELTFLTELGIIAGTALAFTVFFMKIKLPPVIGQLFAGILVGLELDPFKVRQLGHRAFTLAVTERHPLHFLQDGCSRTICIGDS